MATPDPAFVPRVTAEQVAVECRLALCFAVTTVSDAVAHAIVAQRVPLVADPDNLDPAISEFVRTGAVRSVSAIWTPLYGRMHAVLPPDVRAQADALAVYLTLRGRQPGPVDGWPGVPKRCPVCGFDLAGDGYPTAHQADPDGDVCEFQLRD